MLDKVTPGAPHHHNTATCGPSHRQLEDKVEPPRPSGSKSKIVVLPPSARAPRYGGEHTTRQLMSLLKQANFDVVAVFRSGVGSAAQIGNGLDLPDLLFKEGVDMVSAPYLAPIAESRNAYQVASRQLFAAVNNPTIDFSLARLAVAHLDALSYETMPPAIPDEYAQCGSHSADDAVRIGRDVVRLRRLLRQIKPAACIASATWNALMTACSLIDVPTTKFFWYVQSLPKGPYDRFLTEQAHAVLAVSRTLARERFGDNKNVVTLLNGVDWQVFAPPSPPRLRPLPAILSHYNAEVFLIGHVGSFDPNKNQLAIVEACAKERAHLGDFHVLFFGDDVGSLNPSYLDRLRTRTEEVQLTGRIHIMGYHHQLNDVLPRLSTFVYPSYSESFGLALAEAMACGLPCVTTPTCAEVGGSAVIYVNPADPTSLGKTLVVLKNSPQLRQDMGQNARTRVQRKFAATTARSTTINYFKTAVQGLTA